MIFGTASAVELDTASFDAHGEGRLKGSMSALEPFLSITIQL